MKDLQDLTEHLKLPLWLVTLLLWIGATGLVYLMAIVDSL
jgi:hypothetical protein|tara:strand:+ start:160 stop:279 length:120 start_codon:yes stop_codon:yes gene_type:complete